MATNLTEGKVILGDVNLLGNQGNLYKSSVADGNKIPIKSEIEASVTTNSLTAGAINPQGSANIGSSNNRFSSLYTNNINDRNADRFAYVNWNGGMEVGSYIDFHASGNPYDGADYTCRVDVTTDNKLHVGAGIYGAVFN